MLKKCLAAFLLAVGTARAQDCPKLTIKDFPQKDLPPAGFKTDKKLGSASYYYGIEVPIDYQTARYYAFRELSEGTEDPIAGATVLMMIYANGYGVARNLDLSLKLACGNVEGAPAELEGRLQHLKEMKGGGAKEVFDICDDITSGYMIGFCQSIENDRKAYKRKLALAKLFQNWPAKDKAAYDKLRLAATKFFDLRSGNEVDASGTGRAAFSLQESDTLESDFYRRIVKADACSFSNAGPNDYVQADKELNAVYKKVMATKTDDWGTVTTAAIKETQRVWISYRDAWVAFGAVRCPSLSVDSWRTMLTRERIAQLKAFLSTE